MPWDDVITASVGNVSVYGAVQYVFTGGNTIGSGVTAVSGNFGSLLWTNYLTLSTGPFPTGNTAAAGISFGSSGSGATPIFDPVQVAGLRNDYRAHKEDRARKKAEIKARRLFKRVVGDVAYQNFKKRGYHEIYGVSRTRYRLEPGRWVQVMKVDASDTNEVEYELCAHLKFGIPWFDTMAVQHLMLTSSDETEKRFCSIANRHSVGHYPIEEMRRTG